MSFSLPYLLNEPYAALGSRVGFIFGSISAVSILFAYFYVPDVSGRSLEDVDRLFESGIPLRKFKGAKLEEISYVSEDKIVKSGSVEQVREA